MSLIQQTFEEKIFPAFAKVCEKSPQRLTERLFNDFEVYDVSLEDSENYGYAIIYWHKVIQHKIEVYKAGCELADMLKDFGLAFSNFALNSRLQVHDFSKFSCQETMGCVGKYIKGDDSQAATIAYKQAWHHHKHHNDHHAEYWFDVKKSGVALPMQMPVICIVEMVADWIGAGQTYGTPFKEWVKDNLDTFNFHEQTKVTLDRILEIYFANV
ncbi:MAG: DUF5662 family protein [Bacteroidota bacterium]